MSLGLVEKIANKLPWEERQKFLDYQLQPWRYILLDQEQLYTYGRNMQFPLGQSPWARIVYEDDTNWMCILERHGVIMVDQLSMTIPKHQVYSWQIFSFKGMMFYDLKKIGLIISLPVLIPYWICKWAWEKMRPERGIQN